jgi:ABC-type branched-subunit amino acid transport system ATPase component
MLSMQGVSVDLAGIAVLRDISLNLEPSKTYAILGRNGAGKTTLLRTLMGCTILKTGAVRFNLQDLGAVRTHQRANLGIGYAPEERVMFPTMTVQENLCLPCEAIGMSKALMKQRLNEAIQAVPQVEAMLARNASALSGGQGKIAALARALMVGTQLLLVDEPFQGLAPALAKQYADAISRLYQFRPNLCVVITESNRSLLDAVQCTVLTLERGQLGESPIDNPKKGST